MKKLTTYILLAFTITVLSVQTTASAETFAETETQTISEQILIAQGTNPDVKVTTIPKPDFLPGPTPAEQEEDSVRNIFVSKILPFFAIGMIGFVGGLSLLFLVISGVRFATAYGNEESIKKAKDQAVYALVGLLIALLSYTIVTIIINLKIEGDTTKQIDTPPATTSTDTAPPPPLDTDPESYEETPDGDPGEIDESDKEETPIYEDSNPTPIKEGVDTQPSETNPSQDPKMSAMVQ